MSDLLYRLNTEGDGAEGLNLSFEDTERLLAIFDEALRTPGKRDGLCPFCGEGRAYRHENGVRSCGDCLTVWIDDSVLQRLTESEEARSARLALEYQKAHSKPLFNLNQVTP